MTEPSNCPFCRLRPERILHQSPLALAITDGHPVSAGHCLVVPRRHVGSWFDTTDEERREMLQLLDAARQTVVRRHAPAAFNVGINDGPVAGQTVPHVHVHLIPRYAGDVAEPRGGVRWVLPERANYWAKRD
jgi:diadenosine tetraphosphate (Ap4A) HIT family hydrolase